MYKPDKRDDRPIWRKSYPMNENSVEQVSNIKRLLYAFSAKSNVCRCLYVFYVCQFIHPKSTDPYHLTVQWKKGNEHETGRKIHAAIKRKNKWWQDSSREHKRIFSSWKKKHPEQGAHSFLKGEKEDLSGRTKHIRSGFWATSEKLRWRYSYTREQGDFNGRWALLDAICVVVLWKL